MLPHLFSGCPEGALVVRSREKVPRRAWEFITVSGFSLWFWSLKKNLRGLATVSIHICLWVRRRTHTLWEILWQGSLNVSGVVLLHGSIF
jgi:hypothetical protein